MYFFFFFFFLFYCWFSPFLFSALFLLKQSWHSLVALAPSCSSLFPVCTAPNFPLPKAVSFHACWLSPSVEGFWGPSVLFHGSGVQVCRGQSTTDGHGAVGSVPQKLNLQRGPKTTRTVVAANCEVTYEDFLRKPCLQTQRCTWRVLFVFIIFTLNAGHTGRLGEKWEKYCLTKPLS